MYVYIATKYENYKLARELAAKLVGARITFKWWDVAESVLEHKTVVTTSLLRELANKEAFGVKSCKLFIALFPGGEGTHMEIGMALADPDKIVMLASDGQRDQPFYHHPAVIWTDPNDLVQKVNKLIATANGSWR
jgi:hypothetical protein